MSRAIYRVESFRIVGPNTLRVWFDDGAEQTIDFRPVLEGELYGPSRNRELFERVRVDDEVHTLVWPNGADFDLATLHDWPEQLPAMEARVGELATPSKRVHDRKTPSLDSEVFLVYFPFSRR